jgi:hypothetical protein
MSTLTLQRNAGQRVVLTSGNQALTIATVAVATSVSRYSTAVELLAATPQDGTVAYAINTDVHYLRQNGAWQVVATKEYVDGLDVVQVPTSRTITAGAGLTGGGDLSANRTIDVAANADGSIVVNANDVQVGILATDAQHGVRGGGTQHSAASGASAGFMSAADKTKLDGVAALAAALGAVLPQAVGTAAIGVATTASPSDHVHAHGNQLGGALHADATTAIAGFLSALDKAKVDSLVTNGSAVVSTEALTFAVDYNDVNAVVIPAGTSLRTQAQVTALLNGQTNFKYVQEVYNSLPDIVIHTITLNVAAGEHRPRSGETTSIGWTLRGKTVVEPGSIRLVGATVGNWTEVVASQSITAYNSNDNPYVDVSGTPYTADALRGRYAILSNGQTCLIWKNTTSRIYVMNRITSSVVGGTVIVRMPSTILRNTVNGTSSAYSNTMLIANNNTRSFATNLVSLTDITFDPFGANANCVTNLGARVFALRCLFDHFMCLANNGITPDGAGIQSNGVNAAFTLSSSSVIEQSAAATTCDSPFQALNGASISLVASYCFGGHDGCQVSGGGSINMLRSVIEDCGLNPYAKAALQIVGSTLINQDSTSTGKLAEIIGTRGGIPALLLEDAAVNSSIENCQMLFSNNVGPCVVLRNTRFLFGETLTATLESGFKDNGGNLDVGISFDDACGSITLTSQTTVTGALGDVRIGGAIYTYAAILAAGSIGDSRGNSIKKVS